MRKHASNFIDARLQTLDMTAIKPNTCNTCAVLFFHSKPDYAPLYTRNTPPRQEVPKGFAACACELLAVHQLVAKNIRYILGFGDSACETNQV